MWSSVGPAVPFARADLTICLKYLDAAGMIAGWYYSGGPGKPLTPAAKLNAQA